MISSDRLNHIINVARLMKQYCEENGFSKEYGEAMFTLGMLHDIGYEFGEHSNHNEIGSHILKQQNYKYYNEILWHGAPNCDYKSLELDILNYADMHINSKGIFVSFEERLDDIKNRYSENSTTYKNAKIIVDSLIEKGFK